MHTNRREFLALAGLAAARASAKPLEMPIGIQPYTVREQLAKDLEGTLRQLSEMGYESIEVSEDFYGRKGKALRDLLQSFHFQSPSGGFTAADDESWKRGIESAKAIGVKYMIATAPREMTNSLDGWKRISERFNKLGGMSRKSGLTLIYHNHHFEFKVYDGVTAYDQLLRSTDPKLVAMEIDIFWITYAGQDPLAYFQKYPGRFPVWHLKDLKPGFPPSTDKVPGNPFAEVGSGTIDWKRIFSGAKQAGLRHYFVEQDRWDRQPLESARMSCEFLKTFNP
jgi:sugar phosphate isomerase/epimerase